MTELEQYINGYFGVAPTQLASISSFFKEEQIKKGDFLLKTNAHCQQLSFIKEGMLRLFVYAEDKEVTQWISTKGYFITDLSSFVFDTPARWNIQALSDCSLYTIYKNDYHQLAKLIPSWHQLEKLFISKCFVMLEDRVLSHLALSAEERYALLFNQNPALFNQVPLQYIASMLGMTPETFSRIRKKQIAQP